MAQSSNCHYCNNHFIIKSGTSGKYCSHECASNDYGRVYKEFYDAKKQSNIEKYLENPKRCLHCDSIIPYDKRLNKFCNHSCSASYLNKYRPPKTEETKNKTRDSIIQWLIQNNKNVNYREGKPKIKRKYQRRDRITNCVVCGRECIKRKTCSSECLSIYMSKNRKEYLKNPENRKKYKGRSEPSYMEKTFESWLIKHGFDRGIKGYLTELHFINKDNGKNGWIDFIFPKLKMVIELDGTHHIKRQHLDKIRDDYLTGKGYHVIRISIKEYKNKSKIKEVKELLGIK